MCRAVESGVKTWLTVSSAPILVTLGTLFLIGYTIDYNSTFFSANSFPLFCSVLITCPNSSYHLDLHEPTKTVHLKHHKLGHH